MTAPPHTHRMPLTVATHHVVSRLWPSMPSALLPVVEAAVHAAWQVLVWLQLVQDSHKLHHATFEQPTQTLKRCGQLVSGMLLLVPAATAVAVSLTAAGERLHAFLWGSIKCWTATLEAACHMTSQNLCE